MFWLYITDYCYAHIQVGKAFTYNLVRICINNWVGTQLLVLIK